MKVRWYRSYRADPRALPLANRHYNRQNAVSKQFVPPGRCLVLLTRKADALWVTSAPIADYVRHAWAGAWICSCFRNESGVLSSELIRQAVAISCHELGPIPALGMVTFVDPRFVRRKKDYGISYRKAGFLTAQCPLHWGTEPDCDACQGRSRKGLLALQLWPHRFSDPLAPKPLRVVPGKVTDAFRGTDSWTASARLA